MDESKKPERDDSDGTYSDAALGNSSTRSTADTNQSSPEDPDGEENGDSAHAQNPEEAESGDLAAIDPIKTFDPPEKIDSKQKVDNDPVASGEEGENPADEGGGARMGFLGHLMELRRRILTSLFAVVLTTILAFVFYEPIFFFLRKPIDDVNEHYKKDEEKREMVRALGLDPDRESIVVPISTKPLGMIVILMKVAIWAGVVLSSPIVVYEVWSFLAPGLKRSERQAIRPLLMGGIVFFVLGAAFCYFLVFPYTLAFLVWFDVSLGVRPSYTPYEYSDMLITFMLIFGLVFEMPLVASVLAMLRILKPSMLTRYWRYTMLICFVLGSILSPGGDPISMVLMSGALIFLYVVSLILVKLLYPKEGEI